MGNSPNRMMHVVKPEVAVNPSFYVPIDDGAIPPLPFEECEKETEEQQHAQGFTAQFNLIKSSVFSKGEPVIKALQELFGNVVQFVREKGGAAGEQLGELIHSIWQTLCELLSRRGARKGVPHQRQLNAALRKRAMRAQQKAIQLEQLKERDEERVQQIVQKLTEEFEVREAVAARALATAVAAAVPLPDDEVIVVPPPAIEVVAVVAIEAVGIAEVPVVIEARRGSLVEQAARRGSQTLNTIGFGGFLRATTSMCAQAGNVVQACTAGVPLLCNVVDAVKGPIASVGTAFAEGAAA